MHLRRLLAGLLAFGGSGASGEAGEPSERKSTATCRSCGSEGLVEFLSLGPMPLTDAYLHPEQIDDPEPRYPLDVAFCGTCSLVQILYTVPPSEMFEDYQYFSSFSNTLLSHSREHAVNLIKDRRLGTDSLVIELASNDGYLLRNFVEAGIPVLGIDPARGPAQAAEAIGVPTLVEFFGPELAASLVAEGKSADVVIANNVLAHVPDLNGFVAGIATVLKDDGIAEIEVPYVKDLVDHLEFDTIYHEHLCYFSVTALKELFGRHDLHLNEVRHLPIHGGSLRLTAARYEDTGASVDAFLADDKTTGLTSFEYYRDFAERAQELQRSLKKMLLDLKRGGASIAAYGAAAKGTVLLNAAGIGADIIDYVVDRNPHKQGLLLPGVRIPIRDPALLLSDMPDYVLLLAWNFAAEILSDQAAYISEGGRFIVPIPQPKVVEDSPST